ncbi:MAG: hypothetical protein L0Z53_09345, partial [Acidobacteriales bacterium]|nr:hypothetical protein [Terriglobales bacterium]
MAFALSGQTQTGRDFTAARPVTTADEPTRHLVLENDTFRIYTIELEPGERTPLHHHRRDFVTIALDDSDLMEKVPPRDSTVRSWRSGEVIFTVGGLAHIQGNASASKAKLVEVEVKQHWDVAVKTCSEPRQCVHDIDLGLGVIAETTSLFTNGFVTAYRHRVVPGGSLTSSYYSAKGKDQIVLVALTDLQVSFGGISENLKKGQVYYSEATEVEANARETEVRWVVVRIH